MLGTMNQPRFLSETATLRRSGAVWEAVLITPGQGSSGFYTDEMLEAAAEARVFPAGAKNWFKHKEWRGEQRDPRDQWGFQREDARYEQGVGLVAPIKILSHWQEVVESLAEDGQAELSIYAAAIVNEETGEMVGLAPYPTNSVDMVDYPGRPGSSLRSKVERVLESYKPAAESSAEEKEIEMDEKDIKAIAAAAAASVLESLKPFVDFVTKTKDAEEKAAQATVDSAAIESAETSARQAFRKASEAIEAAELLPSQKAALLARAEKGEDIAESLVEATKIADEAKETFGREAEENDNDGADSGRVSERGTAKSAADYKPKGW
jgi:hypothetical protein